MANEDLKTWYVGRLQELISAAEMSAEAASGNASSVQSGELKTMLTDGARIAEDQAAQMRTLLRHAGALEEGTSDPVLKGINAAGKASVGAVSDPVVRDMAVVAITQVGLHYYISAYGSLASAATRLGMKEESSAITGMNDHMKKKDEEYSRLAKTFKT